jgi:hypothetical protein
MATRYRTSALAPRPTLPPGRDLRPGEVVTTFASAFTFLAGLWLLLAPSVLGYRTSDRTAAWNAVATGLGIALASMLQTITPLPLAGPSWALAALGAWLALAPTLLGYTSTAATANDIATGLLVLAAATACRRAVRRRKRNAGHPDGGGNTPSSSDRHQAGRAVPDDGGTGRT